tara:strand:- start:21622 stop:23073 length:1452 start_codon:yes stop_codon:yes gene_type:complete
MSKLNRREFKELLTEWKQNFISEANRVIMSDPEDFKGIYAHKGTQASRVQSSLMTKEIEDMTNLSVEDTLKKLINIADENVFIHFLTKPDKLVKSKITSDKIKTLSVNPGVNWGDQQGIFSYKLNKQGLVNLIEKGKPASGGYGAAANYFQVFKIDDARTVKAFEKDEHVNVTLPILLYPITDRNLQSKLESLIKESFNLISRKNEKSPDLKFSRSTEIIVFLYLSALESKDFNSFIPRIKNKIEIAAKKKLIKYYGDLSSSRAIYYLKNKETKFFIMLALYVSLISDVIASINKTTAAQYGSLLWHLLGVENIDDQGVGLIHSNEMAQAVSFDFSGESLKPIGTFKNYFKDRPIGQYYNMFIDIINDEDVNWDFDIVTKDFNEISDPKEWDLKYLKKMLKVNNPNKVYQDKDLWYYWNDTMEGVLWAFSEHEDKDTGLLLLKYVIDNYPILKDTATRYYEELKENDREADYWKDKEDLYYKS